MEFWKCKRDPQEISGEWRLASVKEVTDNLGQIKSREILGSWDIARLLDGWVDGPAYRYNIRQEYKPNVGHMLLVKTEVSSGSADGLHGSLSDGSDGSDDSDGSLPKGLYPEISLGSQGRKAAVLLSCEDKTTEVIYWVLESIASEDDRQAELDGLTKVLDETFRNGRTVLHYAADQPYNENHALSVADLLLNKFEYGKELVKARDKQGRTALHFAAFHGHINLCRFLIQECKLRVDEKDRNGENMLHFAVNENKGELVVMLFHWFRKPLEDIIGSQDAKGKTPLLKAAASGNKGMMDVLLQLIPVDETRKKYIRQADSFGQTALLEAANRGHVEVVDYLLKIGASPLSERDPDGKTALHCAVLVKDQKMAIQIAEFLLKKCSSDEERSLLLWAYATGVGTAEESASSKQVKYFLQQKRRQNEQSSDKLLLTAIERGHENLAWVLINRGANTERLMDPIWKDSLSAEQKDRLNKLEEHIRTMPERGRETSDQPTKDDSLGRSAFAEGLAELFLNPYVKTPVTVGIFGEWGMGKSSLMIQTETVLLQSAAKLAFPNLLQRAKFPGSKELELSPKGQQKYQKITQAVKKLLEHSTLPDADKDPLVRFLNNYQPKYHDVYRSLALMDHSVMYQVKGKTSDLYSKEYDLGKIPTILTVQYNAWHYQTELEAWAGLAVEVTKVIEESMTTAQRIRTRCRYAWQEHRGSILMELFLPCLLAFFLAGWVGWAAWLLLSGLKQKELTDLKYGSIPVTVVVIVWTVVRQVLSVLKPISVQIMGYVCLPNYKGNLGYQQRVIDDIRFLKEKMGEKPSRLWKFIAGEWCWDWFGLYPNTVKDTAIPKSTPASKDDVRIIVFVDDLDRCSDTVILQVLSAVNLVLAACEINVILGMDKKMIARAIANKFEDGRKMIAGAIANIVENETQVLIEDPVKLAEKYISKIVQLPLALPDPNDVETKNFLSQQLGAAFEGRSDEDIHSNDAEEPHQNKRSHGREGPDQNNHPNVLKESYMEIDVKDHVRDEEHRVRERSPGWLSIIYGPEPETPPELETPLNRQMMMPKYTEREREALEHLSAVVTDFQKLPREWKRFLTYHRLACNILSKNKDVKTWPGWQVQLLVWIFCCWQWKDQMNAIIKNWNNLVSRNDGAMTEDGPSLRNIVEDHYIDDVKNEGTDKEKKVWMTLIETLNKYDVSMHCIQFFQKFRMHCEVGHLPWPCQNSKGFLSE